jgi:regulator of sigma E protease
VSKNSAISLILTFSLFKRKSGIRRKGIGLLPLGGYVKIAGMIDESMDMSRCNNLLSLGNSDPNQPPQRLIIMLGGVSTVNLFSAFSF